MFNNKSHRYTLLRIFSHNYVTHSGNKKTSHSFERLGNFDCLDDVVLFLYDCSDGRFRVVSRLRKNACHSINVNKVKNFVIFG